MRKLIILALLLVAPAAQAAGKKFTLESKELKPNGTLTEKQVFNGFGCTGENVSPQLSWSNPPADTKSFVLTVYDPDAPTGSGWWHWVVFNIPAGTTDLKEGAGEAKGASLPAGSVQSVTDFGQPGFGGPCPPTGDKPHRYIFTVHALKLEKLPLETGASGAMVGFFLGQNTIAKASVTGLYGR